MAGRRTPYRAYVDPRGGCTETGRLCREHATHTLLTMAGILAAGLLIALVTLLVRDAARKRLLRRGTAAEAVITGLDPRGPVEDAAAVKIVVTLAVTPPDGGAAFETWTTGRFPITALPQVGWAVPVRYRPADHHRIAPAGPAAPAVDPSGPPRS